MVEVSCLVPTLIVCKCNLTLLILLCLLCILHLFVMWPAAPYVQFSWFSECDVAIWTFRHYHNAVVITVTVGSFVCISNLAYSSASLRIMSALWLRWRSKYALAAWSCVRLSVANVSLSIGKLYQTVFLVLQTFCSPFITHLLNSDYSFIRPY